MTWRPTHRLTIRRAPERVDVVVHDGRVYTEAQWATREAGWTLEDGKLAPTGWAEEGERYELAPVRERRTRMPGRR